MTTYYKQIPTLEMRVAASPLIVIGVVGKAVGSQVDYYDHEPFVRSTYEVAVHEVLKGVLKQKVIRVEVMGGESEKASTPSRVPMHTGSSIVLMLAAQADENVFVPYFSSAFPLSAEGRIELGPRVADTLGGNSSQFIGENITLDSLRALIEKVGEGEDAAGKVAASMMTGEALPPVTEMPQGFSGGGESSAPGTDERDKSAN
ncbi:MAG: hypothetical protein ACKV2U_12180 [Bryobacteraceae bacterium]